MLDIKPLRYFVVLAETRHFGKAAQALHLSQPPLSRQIAALEESLGVRLFERSSRHVELTAAGRQFYADAKALLASTSAAARNAVAAGHGSIGKLTLGFTMCAAYGVVPRFVTAFGNAFPEVTLSLREVVSEDLAPRVRAGEMDAAILIPGAAELGLERRTVISEPLCVALHRSHPLARARRIAVKRLAEEAFVVAIPDVAPALRNAIVDHCLAAGFFPSIRFEVQLQQTILSLVNEGAGIALVPLSMTKAAFDQVVFRPLVDAPHIDQVLVWRAGNPNPCLRHFLDLTLSAA
ncbi:LysR family transcriptional regulator [Burkholderia sp. Ax-1719]|uniref:LysR family transcriptional regulator n=1 Tax=Burkholderia sp. Ax-1719 TaxID=2608334 RepID=UPI00141F4716|nr:LysR family transcriptional regulator [Burkholderia sp. Ax-1719]NIE64289.1 LysR family transcriptional regulator [Burkholderia sp. Ax-1719]